jgi:heme/copper-type cytochrome/quinol oxidase subunit 3
MNKAKSVMLLFISSEAFFFIALIISYVYYSHAAGTLSTTASYLDVERTSAFTLALLGSSLTVELAGGKGRSNGKKILLPWLIATILFGALFLVGQLSEYVRLIGSDVTVSRDVFGSSFFTLTGFHGLHVLVGLILLSVVFGLIVSGRFKAIESTAFASATLYWHFVDAVWIVVFSVVYLGAIM